MRFSVITPNYNGESYLEKTIQSVLAQRDHGIDIEYIVVDGGSTDESHAIIEKYRGRIDRLIIEKDSGPANAINKGLQCATGDVISWLNADDLYMGDAIKRAGECLEKNPEAAFCFGECPVIDTQGDEIRTFITNFKKMFFPLSSRFMYQVINYISQPAMFFRRSAYLEAGALRENLVAAWDYEFLIRLWRIGGGGVIIEGEPVSAFRWHDTSISGQNFGVQFQEELQVAVADAGALSPQAILHFFVRWGIVGGYNSMAMLRRLRHGAV